MESQWPAAIEDESKHEELEQRLQNETRLTFIVEKSLRVQTNISTIISTENFPSSIDLGRDHDCFHDESAEFHVSV